MYLSVSVPTFSFILRKGKSQFLRWPCGAHIFDQLESFQGDACRG